MRYRHKLLCSGVTLTELAVSMSVAVILVSAAGILLVSGNRSWIDTYNSAHKKIKIDSQAVMLTFGKIGRQSNRNNQELAADNGYVIYNKNGETLIPALSQASEDVVFGDAVEFRYWDVELDEDDSEELIDTEKIATAYALFYIADDQLKVDYGAYPPGAAPSDGGARNTSNITTTVLAENVTTDPETGAFSHSTINGAGQGSVRINITLTDPDDQETIDVMTAVMLRNLWPM